MDVKPSRKMSATLLGGALSTVLWGVAAMLWTIAPEPAVVAGTTVLCAFGFGWIVDEP